MAHRRSQFTLELRVCEGHVGVTAQVIAEQQVIALPPGTSSANVHVDHPWPPGRRSEEPMPWLAGAEHQTQRLQAASVPALVVQVSYGTAT